MTTQPVELPLPVDDRAERLGAIHAGVIERLRREGRPIPGEPDPSP